MSDKQKLLAQFIISERERFETKHNNMFAFSFYEVSRYYEFLQIIHKRHQSLISEYSKVTDNFQKTINKEPGSHTMTSKQMIIDAQMTTLAMEIQLEIESFYQFSKILLDRISTAIEFYFGKRVGKKFRIEDHHWMVTNLNNSGISKIEDYCQAKGLHISTVLTDNMKYLQNEICDFRDDAITHMSSPRTIRGTSVDGKMTLGKLYPQEEKDNIWKTSKGLNELLENVTDYITLIIEFIQTNNDKTALTIKT